MSPRPASPYGPPPRNHAPVPAQLSVLALRRAASRRVAWGERKQKRPTRRSR